MPLTEFKQGTIIAELGAGLNNLAFITKGNVEATFLEYNTRFEKGDMIGLLSLVSGKHCFTYAALSDTTVYIYPYNNQNSIDSILKENADVANLLVNSMCRQMADILYYRHALKHEATENFAAIKDIYSRYEHLCMKYGLSIKKLPAIAESSEFKSHDSIDGWLHDYYIDIKGLDPSVRKHFFYNQPSITAGFLHKASIDSANILDMCSLYHEYITDISTLFLNRDELDIFGLLSSLQASVYNVSGSAEVISPVMEQLTTLISNMTGIDTDYFHQRLTAHNETLTAITDSPVELPASSKNDAVSEISGIKQNLSGSLELILSYSGCPEEIKNKFIRFVHEYTKLPDRNASDDIIRRLRKELTVLFYEIYLHVFEKSLTDAKIPTVIKMFLNFGYVDAKLAGIENADYLYTIADSVKGNPYLGVYTMTEWFRAIYEGKKEPSRNEFDSDYTAYVHELKVSGKITANDETRLLADNRERLKFEIENAFPIVNKITFGRVTTFCPLFSDHNVQKSPESMLITPRDIKTTLDFIRTIDFSAYYRSTLYQNIEAGVPKESVNVEILPDVILTPTIGMRGVMWQEIEGRKRTTPSRMFIPLFSTSDIKTLFIRLTGEFRWEMCKRIQGSRWNDLSDPSLTAELCDYLQFYKNNREISSDTKEAIKTEITRAKNNYKEVFISNYSEWILYESNASPRLNKFVRRILFAYCPFSKPIREKLAQNPQYAEVLNRYNIKNQQRIQQLSRVIQKIDASGKGSSKELKQELAYAEK